MNNLLNWVKKNWALVIVILASLIFSITFSYYSSLKHDAFATSYDLANMDQTAWNTLHGNFFSLTRDTGGTISRFYFHADLILVLLSPLFLIWDNVKMLLIAQAFFVFFAAVPIFLIAKEVLKNKLVAIAVAFAYLIYPWTGWITMYDFHGVALAIFFLSFAYFFLLKKKFKWMWLSIILALLTKENVGFVVAMMGVIAFFGYKEKRQGVYMFIIGMIWAFVAVFLVMPYYSGGNEHWVWDWYDVDPYAVGNNKSTIDSIFKIPKTFIRWDATNYYKWLLKPFGYLPILGFPLLLLALPELGILVLSNHSTMRSTTMHYHAIVLFAMMLAIIYGFKFIQIITLKLLSKTKLKKRAKTISLLLLYLLSGYLLLSSFRMFYFYSPLPTTPGHWPLMYMVGEDERKFEEALRQIPKDASITASSEVRNHLTHRKDAYNLPSAVGVADYIAMVDQNRIIGDYNAKGFETSLIQELLEGKDYELVVNYGHFWLFKKTNE